MEIINLELDKGLPNKQIQKTLLELAKDQYCDICFKYLDPTLQDFSEDGSFMMFCYKCELSVHNCCYGLKTEYEIEQTQHNEKIARYTCDKCLLNEDHIIIECILCSRSTGSLKKYSDDVWIHIYCALLCDLVLIDDYASMKLDCHLLSNQKLNKSKNEKNCEICNNKGQTAPFKDKEGNQKFAHLYCAMTERVNFVAQDVQQQNKMVWNVDLQLAYNENVDQIVDENDVILDKMIIQLCNQYEFIGSKSTKIQEILDSIQQQEMEIQIIESPLKNKQITGKPKDIQSKNLIKDIQNYVKSKIQNDGEQTKNKIQVKQNMNQNYWDYGLTRGGKINFILEQIQNDFSKEEEQANKEWKQFKQKHIIPELLSISFSKFSEQEWKNVFHQASKAFSIKDMILLAVVLQKRLDLLEKKPTEIKYLGEVAEMSYFIPLNFQNNISNIKRRIHVGLAADYLSQRVTKILLPLSTYDLKQGLYIFENYMQNQNILYIYNELTNLYKSPVCNVNTPKLRKIEQQRKVLILLIIIYNFELKNKNKQQSISKSPINKSLAAKQIINTLIEQDIPTESTLSQIMLLLSQIDNKLIDHNKYPEIAQFNDILKKQSKSFGVITNILSFNQKNSDQFELLRGNDQNSFEEDSNQYMKKLLERPMIQAVEKAITKLNTIPLITQEEIEQYETAIRDTEKWIAFYQENLEKQKPFNEFERMIQSISKLSVISKEVVEAVKQYISFKQWYFTLQNVLVQVKPKQNFIINYQMSKNVELIAIEKVQDLVKQYQESQIILKEDDIILDELLATIDFAHQLQNNIKIFLSGGGDIYDLKKIESDYVSQSFYISEYITLQEKLKVNDEIKSLLFNPSNLQDIQSKLQQRTPKQSINSFEKKIIKELEKKFNIGKELQMKVIKLLQQKKELEPYEVSLVNQVIKESKQHSIIFPELSQCKNIINECNWLYSLYIMFTNQFDISSIYQETFQQADMLSEYILYVQTQIINLPFTLSINQFSVLKVVFEEGKKLEIFDLRINQILLNLSNVIWKYQVQNIQQRTAFKFRELEKLILSTPSQLIEQGDIVYTELNQKYQQVKNWQIIYQNIIEILDIEQNLLYDSENITRKLIDKQEKKLIDMQKQVNDLQKGYQLNNISQYSDLEYDANVTNKIKKIVDVLVLSAPLIKQIKQNTTNVSLVQLKNILNEMNNAEFSETLTIYQKVKEQIQVTEEHIKRLITKASEQNLTFEKAKVILNQLNEETENENQILNVKQQIQQNVTLCKEIDKRLNNLLNTYKIFSDLFKQDVEQIIQDEIDYIKKEIHRAPLEMTEQSKLLNKYSWLFTANKYLFEEDKPKKTLKEWVDLLQNDNSKQNADLKNQINEQIKIAVSLIKKTTKIKNIDKKRKNAEEINLITKEEIVQLFQQIQQCKIALEAEEQYLRHILERVSQTMNELDSLFKAMPKAPVKAFKKLQSQLVNLPVDMTKYYRLIDSAFKKYQELDSALKNIEVIDSNQAQIIINDYQTCNILVPEAERILYAFELSQNIVIDIEKRLNQSTLNNQPGAALSLEEIKSLQILLQNNVQIGTGNSYIQLRVRLYILQIACLRNSPLSTQLDQVGNMPPAEVVILNTRVKTPTRLTMSMLQLEEVKKLLREGYALQNCDHRNVFLADCVAFLEKVVRKIEDIERELYQIKDIDLLSTISPIFLNYIDCTQTIQNYIRELNRDSYYTPQVKSIIIYDEYEYDDIQIDMPVFYLNQAHLPVEIEQIIIEAQKDNNQTDEEEYQYEPTDYSSLEFQFGEKLPQISPVNNQTQQKKLGDLNKSKKKGEMEEEYMQTMHKKKKQNLMQQKIEKKQFLKYLKVQREMCFQNNKILIQLN